MSIQEWREYLAEEIIRKAVRHWAKINPRCIDLHTSTIANDKRYLIQVLRSDYKSYRTESEDEE